MRRFALAGLLISGCVLPAFEVVSSFDEGNGGTAGSGATGAAGNTAGSDSAGKNPGGGAQNGGGTTGAEGGSGDSTNGGTSADGGGGDPTSGGSGVAGQGGSSPEPLVAKNYAITGSWPERSIAIAQQPGDIDYDKVEVHDRFLGESCAIGDYDGDGIADISSGRRWYRGPAFTAVHTFRGGHDDLPRTGATEELTTGSSDDWGDYAFDVDGDGYTDIINVSNPEANATASPAPAPQPAASAYWYKNPGGGDAARSDVNWQAYLIHDDVRLEQHGITDVDGDGKPELLGACRGCNPARSKGYYAADWSDPTKKWTFRAVTIAYTFPFGDTGWLHGLGFGDVDDDGQPDLLERGGVWLDARAPTPNLVECPATNCGWIKGSFYDGIAGDNRGGSHMFAFDVDGDGDSDVVSAEWAHGSGFAWYEHTSEYAFTKRLFPTTFTQLHAMEVADMDGDDVPDLITGKTRYAHPNGYGDPDLEGAPVIYVYRTRRNMPHAASGGSVTFEPVLVDDTIGVGRQIAVGHVNDDGIVDLCIASKLGLAVFLGN